MATIPQTRREQLGEERFFFIMACVMSAIIVAGFSMNLAMGRSTFAVPLIYHVHALVFFSWVALYLAQNFLVASDRLAVHRRLGWASVILAPVMVVLGVTIMVVSMRRTGGPFFFDQNEFMISNPLSLVCFVTFVFAAVKLRRNTGWHRRLMFMAMAILTGPGLGRLLPMPLLMPHAWRIMVVVTMIIPVIMMIADKRRNGQIHPAWLWGIGAVLLTQVVADVIAYSDFGLSLTQSVIEGTPGAERPMSAFLPPEFAAP
jgi:hypothetical protein